MTQRFKNLVFVTIAGVVATAVFLSVFQTSTSQKNSDNESGLADSVLEIIKKIPIPSLQQPSRQSQNQLTKLCGSDFSEGVNWLKNLRIKESYVHVQNIHFIDSTGLEKRLHVVIDESSTGSRRLVKFFKLDQDGLPENMATPKEYMDLNPEQTIQSIRSQFKVIKDTEAGELVSDENTNIAYSKVSDQFTSIEISDNTSGVLTTLVCSSGSSCRCIK